MQGMCKVAQMPLVYLKSVFLAQKTTISFYKTKQQMKLLESRPTKTN